MLMLETSEEGRADPSALPALLSAASKHSSTALHGGAAAASALYCNSLGQLAGPRQGSLDSSLSQRLHCTCKCAALYQKSNVNQSFG